MSIEQLEQSAKLKGNYRNFDIVRKAYDFAERAHSGQKRASGEPYFVHPCGVASILLNWGLDEKVAAAALLHDVLEDTDVKPEELRREFGDEIFHLVDGVTKLDEILFQSREKQDTANLQKTLLAAVKDIRVLIMKFADKLHNMQTLRHLPKKKQRRIAAFTLTTYAPLAAKLGMHEAKNELEQLAFEVLEPEKNKKIQKLLQKKIEEKVGEIEEMVEKLKEYGEPFCEFEIYQKTPYMVVAKMRQTGKKLSEMHDAVVLVALTNQIADCYTELGNIHLTFKPLPNKVKDYIAYPKGGIYQALHTTVLGPNKKPIKTYIRTFLMDEVAKKGIVACMLTDDLRTKEFYNEKLEWLSDALKKPLAPSKNKKFLALLGLDGQNKLSFVFGQNGEIIELPAGSTVLDFAHQVYPQKAHFTKGAIVNDRGMPIWHELQQGSIVDIVFGRKSMINESWLSMVETTTAQDAIREHLKANKKTIAQAKTNLISLKVTAIDRIGLSAELFDIIASKNVNTYSANVTSSRTKKTANCNFYVDIPDPKVLKRIVYRLSKVKGVRKVTIGYSM